MNYSVVIPTYNRANDLYDTLQSLAQVKTTASWELIIVDNNSCDNTRAVVICAAERFPVELRYLFEKEQGRSAALNTGIRAARGEIIVNTDDDVRIEPDWLDRIGSAFDRLDCDYIGGRVIPQWSGTPPDWLPKRGGQHYSRVLAVMDWGDEPVEFGKRVPLGVNVAFRREVFAVAGFMDNRIGRKAGTLLGQEVRDWVGRAKTNGLRGYYAPEVTVKHLIPVERLDKHYFRRWFYWHGISRALLYEQQSLDVESAEIIKPDSPKAPRFLGIPRHIIKKAVKTLAGLATSSLRGQQTAAFEHELWLCFFAGVVKQRWSRTAE